jgi:flagellar motor switch protein FliG
MTVIVLVISFIAIWLGTTFLILRYIKKLKDDLLARFSDTEILSEKKGENNPVDEEGVYYPFDYVKRADPKNLLNFIKQEHPQVIALVLAHLEPDKASVILQNLPSELQGDVSRRIAAMDQVSPEVTREIEQVLEKKLSALSGEDYVAAGGVESIAKIINHVDRASRDKITEAIEDEDPKLAYMINELIASKEPKKKFYHEPH